MPVSKLCTYFLSVVILSFAVSCFAQSSQQDPVSLLKSVSDNMLSGLKTNKANLKTKPEVVYNLAYKFVVPNADLAEMSRRVLPPAIWNAASSVQRLQFQKEFTTTLIRTYASALTSYQDQSVTFHPLRGGYQGRNSVEISSEITGSNAQPIHVTYRLVRKGNAWKLYDLSVEGVSMLESFRAQFGHILAQGNMNMLLEKMSGHNQRS